MELISGRYRLTGLVGRGGMGRVHRAVHLGLRRDVALKLFDPIDYDQNDANSLQRFIMEGRILAACRHPNVVDVFDSGTTDEGAPFLVMELLEGSTLSAMVDRRGPFPPATVARIGIGVAGGLAKLHSLGFLHRDVKASNVMWTVEARSSVVKLIDFGLVKPYRRTTLDETSRHPLTQPGMLVGSPTAMSPEQISGAPLETASDVYGLGTMLHLLATGRPVFEGETAGVLRAHLSRRPDLLSCHPALAAVIERCLAKDPRLRFQTMAPLISALETAEEETQRAVAPPRSDTVPIDRSLDAGSTVRLAQ